MPYKHIVVIQLSINIPIRNGVIPHIHRADPVCHSVGRISKNVLFRVAGESMKWTLLKRRTFPYIERNDTRAIGAFYDKLE